MRRGFTVVELVITISIMAILLTLAVVNLVDTQVSSRDAERKADIESLQLYLEDFSRNDSDWGANIGLYPSINLPNGTVDFMRDTLRDIDMKVLMAPGVNDPKLTFKAATNNLQNVTDILPKPTVSEYIYQPIDSNGNLCNSTDCRKYNLYYRLEADNTVYMVTSKNQ